MSILAESASASLSREPQIVLDRTTPIMPLVTELPIITTEFPPVGNMINFEQKATARAQAVTNRPATVAPASPAESAEKPWEADYYSPSASGPLGKADISEIKEEELQSTTVISQRATDSWNGVMEGTQTQESVTQFEQIEVGPLVTSMETSKHAPSKELTVTQAPFVSTEMTPESKTEGTTASPIPGLVSTNHSGFTLGEDDLEDRALTIGSGQSTLVFSQIPEVITVSKTSEDLESMSAPAGVSPVTPDRDGATTDSWEEKQTHGPITEDVFGQSLSTTPFPSLHITGVESFPYSGDKILAEGISTVIHPLSQTEMTQGRERTETPGPERRTDMYTPDGMEEKVTKDPFTGNMEEEFSGMRVSTSSSEQIQFTEHSVEMTKPFDSPASTTVELSGKPTEARDVEEDATRTLVALEADVSRDTTKRDKDVTEAHVTHSTLSVEVVTVSKWSRDENDTTSKPLESTEQTASPKQPSVLFTTTGANGKEEEIPSFTENGRDEFTHFPDSTQKPLEKFIEEDSTAGGKLTVQFQPTTPIGIVEKSTLRDSVTEERVPPTSSTEGQVVYATLEGSAWGEGEDVDISRTLSTVVSFPHTSDVEGLTFVNYSSTLEPTTYTDTSRTIPPPVIPKTEWGALAPSIPSEGEVLGESSQDIRVIELPHLEATMVPETLRTTAETVQGTTQEEFPWEEQTARRPDHVPTATAAVSREAAAPLGEDDDEGSAYMVPEGRLVTSVERVPVLETTPVGKIEHPTSAVTEPKVEEDEMVTIIPSTKSEVFLSPEPEEKYETEGSSPTEFTSPSSPFSIRVTPLVEETTLEKREKISVDYVDLGSGLFEEPKATELAEFSTTKATVPSDITTALSSVDRHRPTSAFKPSSASTEKPPLIDREPSEETTQDMVLIGESTPHLPPTTLVDLVAKETEADIDREYFTVTSPPSTQSQRPPTVEGKEAFRPQAFSTPQPPVGTKFHHDINVYIIEVRENKTGKSLLSRHTFQGHQNFTLKVILGKKNQRTKRCH